MIDKIIAKIKRYPFQTGIVTGLVLCLLLVGFFNLFQDNGRTLAANNEIIREDYLRMSINSYTENRDEQLAGWRYEHLGRAGDETLKLMRGDTSIPARDLISFADAIGKSQIVTGISGTPANTEEEQSGVPASPRKGLSGFGKVVLIILGVLVLCAAGLYIASLVKTRKKQKRRTEVTNDINEEPLDMVSALKTDTNTDKGTATSDTLFDLDKLFPNKDGSSAPEKAVDDDPNSIDALFKETAYSDKAPEITEEEAPEVPAPVADEEFAKILKPMAEEVEEPIEDFREEAAEEVKEEPASEEPEPVEEVIMEPVQADLLNEEPDETETGIETEVSDVETVESEGSEAGEPAAADSEAAEPEAEAEAAEEPPFDVDEEIDFSETEKPLIETESITDPNSEDELLNMIRGSKKKSDDLIEKTIDLGEAQTAEVAEIIPEPETPAAEDVYIPEDDDDSDEAVDDVLIHYQSTYRIGNDMYDEVFSIEQGDVFRGECGISIGETLNNTDPKAVTAFEVWLFDKDDIHTATWYLMSDFALSNEGIQERLSQRGTCERIRKNMVYTLETDTMLADIKVIDLEYGNEMEEKNSYFTNVTFDIVVHEKRGGNA